MRRKKSIFNYVVDWDYLYFSLAPLEESQRPELKAHFVDRLQTLLGNTFPHDAKSPSASSRDMEGKMAEFESLMLWLKSELMAEGEV